MRLPLSRLAKAALARWLLSRSRFRGPSALFPHSAFPELGRRGVEHFLRLRIVQHATADRLLCRAELGPRRALYRHVVRDRLLDHFARLFVAPSRGLTRFLMRPISRPESSPPRRDVRSHLRRARRPRRHKADLAVRRCQQLVLAD